LTEVIAMKADIARNQITLGEHVQQINEQNRLLQRICSRVSTTDAERQQCFDR
jgi:hypothetical protein